MGEDLKQKIVTINDWPRPGIVCYDIAPLLKNGPDFAVIVERLAEPYRDVPVDAVVGIEARGFLLAGALADRLKCGVTVIRKKNKLPRPVVAQEYSYEYAAQVIEMQAGAIRPGERVVVVDDTLATGGTMAAAVKLINQLGGNIVGISFVVEVEGMDGRTRLKNQSIHSLVNF